MTFSNLENKCEIEQNLVGMYCLCVYEHANCMDTPCIGGSKGGGGRDARPPPPGRPNSFIFMQVSAKNLQNNPNLGVGAAPSGKSWIRHCHVVLRHVYSRYSLNVLSF